MSNISENERYRNVRRHLSEEDTQIARKLWLLDELNIEPVLEDVKAKHFNSDVAFATVGSRSALPVINDKRGEVDSYILGRVTTDLKIGTVVGRRTTRPSPFGGYNSGWVEVPAKGIVPEETHYSMFLSLIYDARSDMYDFIYKNGGEKDGMSFKPSEIDRSALNKFIASSVQDYTSMLPSATELTSFSAHVANRRKQLGTTRFRG